MTTASSPGWRGGSGARWRGGGRREGVLRAARAARADGAGCALLPYVAPAVRRRGPRADRGTGRGVRGEWAAGGPARPQSYASAPDAVQRLAAAVEREELDDVDAAADWFGARCRPDELVGALTDVVVDRLSAAGHGNIYLAAGTHPAPADCRARCCGILRAASWPPPRSTASPCPERSRCPTSPGCGPGELLDPLTQVDVVDPPPSLFIAPMVEHAEDHGAFDGLLDDTAVSGPGRATLRAPALRRAGDAPGAGRAGAVRVDALPDPGAGAAARGECGCGPGPCGVRRRGLPRGPLGDPRPRPGRRPRRRPSPRCRHRRGPRRHAGSGGRRLARRRPGGHGRRARHIGRDRRTTPTGSSTRSRASTRRRPTRRTARPTSPRPRTSTPGGSASSAADPTTGAATIG